MPIYSRLTREQRYTIEARTGTVPSKKKSPRNALHHSGSIFL
jgi:hypothetical protein